MLEKWQVIILDDDLPFFHHHDKLDMMDESEELPFQLPECKVSKMFQQHVNCIWIISKHTPENIDILN